MTTTYRKHTDRRVTPQSEPLPGQIPNSAGGFSWGVDDWVRLRRFLILGSEGGTYYIGERELTKDNATAVQRCIDADGWRVVKEIVEISDKGLAASNDPALFALAMCTASKEETVKMEALEALPKVARIGTHLFHFIDFVEGFRGWGRGLRRAVANWYLGMPIERLAMQVVKYKQRDGWSHRDLLRLSHPKTADPVRNSILKYAVNKALDDQSPALLIADSYAEISEKDLIANILQHNLPRECVPSEYLQRPDVWAALLEGMPLTAMIRNLGKMTQVGLIKQMSHAATYIKACLEDEGQLKRARIHPFSVLLAMKTYSSGQGFRGSLTWSPVPQVVDALDAAFYASFENVEPTGQRTLLALDISSSMGWSMIRNSNVCASEAAAAMALITANTEPMHGFVGFSDNLMQLNISPRQRLDDVVRYTRGMTFGRTDCSLPMVRALEEKAEVDLFVIYTDNETWAGPIHPVQALNKYRERMGIPAKLVVVGMTSTDFTIADPNDSGMLDVVGFDPSAPRLIAEFAEGRV
jgi:60 kDa SS-A/Ro ribonucleoprotein